MTTEEYIEKLESLAQEAEHQADQEEDEDIKNYLDGRESAFREAIKLLMS